MERMEGDRFTRIEKQLEGTAKASLKGCLAVLGIIFELTNIPPTLRAIRDQVIAEANAEAKSPEVKT